jgi:hypothetical protein
MVQRELRKYALEITPYPRRKNECTGYAFLLASVDL